jgi:hypothetical protein
MGKEKKEKEKEKKKRDPAASGVLAEHGTPSGGSADALPSPASGPPSSFKALEGPRLTSSGSNSTLVHKRRPKRTRSHRHNVMGESILAAAEKTKPEEARVFMDLSFFSVVAKTIFYTEKQGMFVSIYSVLLFLLRFFFFFFPQKKKKKKKNFLIYFCFPFLFFSFSFFFSFFFFSLFLNF